MTQTSPLLDPALPLALLQHCPAYEASPLAQHSHAGHRIWVKDETGRMGLGAFKALGGVYAVAQLVAQSTGVPAPALTSEAARAKASDLTFVCASAGNHGMSVAAGAQLFGAGCRIHLAETVPEAFAARLRAKGAGVVRSGATYEASIAAAIADAQSTGAIHLADGSWPGYTEPPRLVMEGYTIIAEEMRQVFEAQNSWPSHVFLQAGVGGLAGAVAHMIRENWARQPEIIIVEPTAAPCIQASVAAGRMVTVEGPVSNMGRLDCKDASLLAFDILREAADRYVTISDEEGAQAVTEAGAMGFGSTPSGASGLAALLKQEEPMAAPLVILSEGLEDA
ncbi:pyridoxal-phosphate dependent enzyme [Primorskyibacter sp. S187A]|uniref:pyridoxal-phosphate dependent enzyme n=1 Tax=Primorskyibacter sp. S187A TaxID=3415130 RepID=UPI003C7E3882